MWGKTGKLLKQWVGNKDSSVVELLVTVLYANSFKFFIIMYFPTQAIIGALEREMKS